MTDFSGGAARRATVPPSELREARLQEIRREAQNTALIASVPKIEDLAPRATPETGYYGLPLLKGPQWSSEIPLYFFCGGAAGAAAIIASVDAR